MQNVMDRIRTTRILAGIGIVLLIVGVFTPYARFSIFGYSISISLWGYWQGKVIMILAVANLLFIFEDVVEKYLPQFFDTNLGKKIKELDNRKASIIPTILTAILAIVLTADVGVSLFKYYNIGFYAFWLGAICLVIYALLRKKNDDNFKIQP